MSKYKGQLPLSISQNYLTSAGTIRRVLKRTSIHRSDHVIEIGAGKGHITRELTKISGSVEAYELDDRLCSLLQSRLGKIDNLSLKHQDFLSARMPQNRPYKVFSNIPFSITTKIMGKLTCANPLPQEIWLVMEKGAGKRFLGKPRETPASLPIKPYFDIEICYYFSRQDFHPAPSVDVVLLHLTRKADFDIPLSQRKAFARFVENSFRYGLERQLTKRQISTALRQAGLPSIRTAREILYIQWLCLFRCWRRFHPDRK